MQDTPVRAISMYKEFTEVAIDDWWLYLNYTQLNVDN